jgi:hypothetical protein
MTFEMTLSASEVAFFSPPPRPPRRTSGDGGIGRLIRAVRRELANAASQSPVDAAPRLRDYPY